ncbi:MAG: hypothetical protein ACLR0U_26570 [Enterocloster clostridioformis]
MIGGGTRFLSARYRAPICDKVSGGRYTWDIGVEVNHCVVDGSF